MMQTHQRRGRYPVWVLCFGLIVLGSGLIALGIGLLTDNVWLVHVVGLGGLLGGGIVLIIEALCLYWHFVVRR